MFVRAFVVCLLVPWIVLLGTGAGADTGAGPRTRPVQQRVTVNVYGCDNVIATGRSVLTVGHHSPVNANTGDVSSSGTLGIAADRSRLGSGASGEPASDARLTRKPSREERASRRAARGAATAISGYEDHSVRVAGQRQMAVYDDSNLFVNRNGRINGNTGDTDSSGLNAVDVSGSTVRSGDHIEGGQNDDEPGGEKNAVGAPPAGRPEGSSGTRPPSDGQAASSVTDDGGSGANGGSAFTIGGDGYDNLGVKVRGRRNIAAYDDSNVVVGGTGDVNAQIGDSDTSGAVVMGINDSDIGSGNST